MRIFSEVPNINFMGQRTVGLWASLLLTVGAVAVLWVKGLNLGIDFTGGVLVEVAYPETVELEQVRGDLAKGGYHNAIAQYFGGSNIVLIRLPPAENANSAEVSTRILQTLKAEENSIDLRRIDFVGAVVGEELTDQGTTALLFAFIGIFIYIMFRFQWKFSAGAVIAFTHDALMAAGFLSFFEVEFDITTVAAILALIGYSNNETVVIFDRVRENLVNMRRTPILDIVNLSVNQTLMRSIITHVTTLLVCFALYFLGGPSVHSFSVTLIVGVIVATYSSIYVSTSFAVFLGVTREDLLPPKDDVMEDGSP